MEDRLIPDNSYKSTRKRIVGEACRILFSESVYRAMTIAPGGDPFVKHLSYGIGRACNTFHGGRPDDPLTWNQKEVRGR